MAAILAGVWAGAAHAEIVATDYTSLHIAEMTSGVVCNPLVVGEVAAPGTVAGVVNVLEGVPEFTDPSHRVPAVLGISFGVLVTAHDADSPVVEMVLTHPPMGPGGATMQTYNTAIWADAPTPILYSLEVEDELVLGTWIFEARAGGEVLYRMQFDLVPPQEIPELAGLCNFEDLLS